MKKLFLTFTLIISFALLSIAKAPKQKPYWANSSYINSGWLYLEKDSRELPTEADNNYTEISLPHTWNAHDALSQFEYRRGASWYRKNLTIKNNQLDKRLYLRFGAAGQQAEVYVNGTKLIYHNGGYSAFTCEITDIVKAGNNVVDVWVSNLREKFTAPQTADFNFYGGLYRSVELIEAPKLSISRKYMGSSGVRIWSENVSEKSSDFKVRAMIDNGATKSGDVVVRTTISDKKGRIVSEGTAKKLIAASTTSSVEFSLPKISNPELWSPENPTLYDVKIEVELDGKKVDELELKHGFRFYEFTSDKGFFLNGKPYKLNGVSRHQDYYGEGNALSMQRHYDDILLMKEAGINWLRMAHYQQDDYIVSLCDRMGILVWEEIPWVNLMPEDSKFAEGLESMLTELIEQHYNNSSVIIWGLGNEVWMNDRGDGKANIFNLLTHLNEVAHKSDHTRKTVFVNGDNDRPLDFGVTQIADLFGYNLYRGWYQQNYETLTERLENIRSRMNDTPMFLSEFGAGSDLRIHSENPVKQDFSIEYQNDYLESHFKQIEKIDWLCGFNKWAWADFGSAHRGDSKPHINQKGLVTFTRSKKDAFYLFKSYYSKEPVLHIESPTWTERVGDAEKVYRVFSNMKEVEFFHNGKSLGVQNSGFEWDVTLIEGKNSFKAIGRSGKQKMSDSYSVNYSQKANNFTATATLEVGSYVAENAIDGDDTSYFMGKKGAEIVVDIQQISLVNGVSMSVVEPSKGGYEIEIATSADGNSYQTQFSGTTNPRTVYETFMFAKQQEIRYIKVVCKGGKNIETTGFYEIKPLITFEKAEKNLYEKIGAGEH
ncbi:MAG: glycoside hydrolase family 2 TIM barrel-domain containing protein [Rikenellaceae bacterium]